jgi:hypothetical protein
MTGGLCAVAVRLALDAPPPLLLSVPSADLASPGVTSLPERSTARKRLGTPAARPTGGGGGNGAAEASPTTDGDRIVRCA